MSVVKRDALEKMPRHGKKRYKNRQMMEAQGQMNVSVAKDVRMMEAQGQMNVSVATDKQMLECFYFFFPRIYAFYQALAFQIVCL